MFRNVEEHNCSRPWTFGFFRSRQIFTMTRVLFSTVLQLIDFVQFVGGTAGSLGRPQCRQVLRVRVAVRRGPLGGPSAVSGNACPYLMASSELCGSRVPWVPETSMITDSFAARLIRACGHYLVRNASVARKCCPSQVFTIRLHFFVN